ncbi:hypothetical protein [Parabacteroides sp. AM08-6]|uniref:hypothetical protein n=1 Tax=Parabacteroides sp. AM08-6 TaxID=2292053 RepID=UPI000EFEDDFC|nr:hypothetical protein [Parabacteroides sp. AM08-6]RHJ86517.1 hypothetical protein DW103_02285 [Parabacteroides sp. AM08-6]
MKRFLTCFLILLACSCTKTIKTNIPPSRVYLRIDLRYEDKDLVGTLNHKEFTAPRKAGEYVGYSGVLVVCGFDNVYYAYDLCCPHEASKTNRIVPDNTGKAKCPKCGTVYDIGYGTGAPVEGVSEYALQRYNVTSLGQELLIQN